MSAERHERASHRRGSKGVRVRRMVSGLLASVVLATLIGQIPPAVGVAASNPLPVGKDVKGVKTQPVAVQKRPEWTAGKRELTEADLVGSPAVAGGVQTIDLSGSTAKPSASRPANLNALTVKTGSRGVQAGVLPVYVAPVGGDGATGPSTVSGTAGQARGPASSVRKVKVEVLDSQATAQVGIKGMVVQLSRADGVSQPGPAQVTVDYRSLSGVLGRDAMTRLRLVRLSDGSPVAAVQDSKAHTLSATLSLTAASTGVAVVAAAAGESGDYTATKLTPASTWQVSQQTGAFAWSYPIPVPAPPGGFKPEIALAYNSGSIDGRTSGNNTQGSEVGDGWDMAPGFIERSYRTCSDDRSEKEKPNPNNKDVNGGDLCWFNDNATMSFQGSSTELAKVPPTADDKKDSRVRYKAVSDDGSRIELIDRGSKDNVENAYWRVTKIDGAQYFFGQAKAQGGSSDGNATNSVLKTPVYSNHPDESGYAKEFSESKVTRPWRWNLDYSVDPNGNTITYFYSKDIGAYGREGDEDKRTEYDRNGMLDRIEYGSRADDGASVRPAQRVVFKYADRCLGDCRKSDDKPVVARFPDTPWEQYCDKAPCKTQFSPTFWTEKRLETISTEVYSGTGNNYAPVDSWTLGHTYLPAGDNESTPMWLKSITRVGEVTSAGGSKVNIPSVVFDPNVDVMPNRVDTPNGHSSLFRSRIDTITTESGAQIGVTYSKPECDGAPLPKPWSNSKRCFPQFYGAEGEDPKLDWFNKYVVTRLDVYDNTGGFEHQQTNYRYLDTPAWAYDDSELVKPKKRTWGQFRGYGRVQVRQGVESGVQSVTEYTYFRGMNGDKQPKDKELPPIGTPKKVQVTDSQGVKVDDHPAFAGMVREEVTYNGVGGDWISGSISTPVAQGPTATSGTLKAYKMHTETVRARTKLSNGKTRWTKTVTKVNGDNLPEAVTDFGEVKAAGDDVDPADNRCTRTSYVRNESVWMFDRVREVQQLGVGCDAKTVPNDKVLSATRTYYDNPDTHNVAPTRGLPVRVEVLQGWNGTTQKFVTTSRTGYDKVGRVVSQTDARDRAVTATTYKPPTAGPVTEVGISTTSKATKAVLAESTTVLNPELGVPVKVVDSNKATTHLTYDGAGRLRQMWAPGRDKAKYPTYPTASYEYQLRKEAPSTVTAQTLVPAGSTFYRTKVTLMDGLLRERQTQTQTVSGGRSITDTVYDSRGLVAWTSSPYSDIDNKAPDTTLVTPVGRPEIPAVTQNVYDGAGRLTDAIFLERGDEKWRTRTAYAGERTSVTPPAGGTATTTITNVRGLTSEVRHYHDPKNVGKDAVAYDRITYGHTDRDELKSAVKWPTPDAKRGTTWSYGYDLRGNRIETRDPDAGVSTSEYDAAGLVTWSKDARGKSRHFSYDDLGRKTAERLGSATGSLAAEWQFDTLPNGKGKLTKAIRYEPAGSTNAYVTAVTGYEESGNPSGSQVSVPKSESGLCASGEADPCTYSQTMTYRPNGQIDQVKYPAVAGLPAETLTTMYNKVGLPAGTYGTQIYVQEVMYNQQDQLISRNLGEHGSRVALTYGYNEATGRQTRFTAVGERSTADIYNLSYTHDAAGNFMSIKDSPRDTQPSETQCFNYDYLRRLKEAWTPGSGSCTGGPKSTTALGGPAPYWRSYTYDTSGNRQTEVLHGKTDTTRTYAYPAPGGEPGSKPHAATKVASTGATKLTQQYTYDGAGNTICRPTDAAKPNTCATDGKAGAGSQALTWTDEGRVKTVTDASGATTFVYDTEDNRLIRRDPTGSTLYLPGGTEVRANKTGGVSGTRYYSHAGSNVAVRTPTSLNWIVTDHQNTGSATVGSDTNPTTNRQRTLPFGDVRGPKPTEWVIDKGFVGGTKDNTGLTHLNAREYDPILGRFISVDPIMDLANPQQWNAYSYANDSPITLSDPTGLNPAYVDYFRNRSVGGGKQEDSTPDEQTTSSTNTTNNQSGTSRFAEGVGNQAIEIAKTPIHIAESMWSCTKTTFNPFFCTNPVGPLTLSLIQDPRGTVDGVVDGLIGGVRDDWKSGNNAGAAGRASVLALELILGGKGLSKLGKVGGASKGGIGARIGKTCNGNSFAAGTLVLLAGGGTKEIEDLEVGDVVVTTDPELGQTTTKEITKKHINDDTELTNLTVVGAEGKESVVETTWHHRFWSKTRKQWVDAAALRAGEELFSNDGRGVAVTKVSNQIGSQVMYDLTVAEIHTYYVLAGKTPVLVHNDNGIPLSTQVQGRNQPLTNKQAEDLAKYLGYKKTKFRVRGQPVFTNGKTFISQDIGSGDGSHNGGTWKTANSVDDLGRKSTRLGTTDALLNKIGC